MFALGDNVMYVREDYIAIFSGTIVTLPGDGTNCYNVETGGACHLIPVENITADAVVAEAILKRVRLKKADEYRMRADRLFALANAS